MAQHTPFKGIKRVLSSSTAYTQNDSFLYFVRESAQATSGDIWFMGHHYGHFGEHDLDIINTALDGFLGDTTANTTNVKDYIDEAVSAITSGMTTSVELDPNAFSGLTIENKSETPNIKDYVINLQNVAREDLLEKEIQDREDADEALQAELDDVETAVGLSTGGTYVPGDGKYTSSATSVADAIDKLDDALASAVTDLEETIEEKINELDATVSATSTNSYMTVQVVEENGKLSSVSLDDSALNAAIEAMDLAEVHEAGKAIVAVSEDDGVVSATAGTIAAQYVDVADADNHFTANNVEAALAELYTGYTAGDAALLGDATESGNTLGKLEDRIEELSADAKEYHLVKNEDNLPAEVKEQYYLVDADGNQSGATINIYKDSHIKSITYITDSADTHFQNLKYEYIDVCGDTKTEYVDMSDLILEQEFGSGVTANNAGIVHGVVDPASENFLTVGAAGFKLSGVQDAINAAVSAETEAREDADDAIESALTLTAQTLVEMIENAASAATTEVVEGTDAGNNLSIAETAGADGHKIYTINLTDVASASALTQEISDREDADAAIQAELDAVESELGFDGTAYTQTVKNYISGNTVAEDIHLLDAALDANNDAIIALQEALQEEEDARVSGDTALDERITLVEDNYITAVTVNGVSAATQDNEVSLDIQADDIELGKAITADTASTLPGFAADDKVDEVLQAIVDKLNEATAGSYTGVTSSGNTLKVTKTNLGNNIEFEKESSTEATVAAGHLELAQNSNHEWYGQMFWIDEETA